MWRFLIISALLNGTLCLAQRDSSLTQDFPGLSAKERSRIAARENDEALKDAEYQKLMEEGERLFRSKRYDDALEGFKLARSRRPYNVYPKVKIQDLEALIAKRDAAIVAEPVVPAPEPVIPASTPITSVPAPAIDPSPVPVSDPLPVSGPEIGAAPGPVPDPVPVPEWVTPPVASIPVSPPPPAIRKVDPAPPRQKAARSSQKEIPIKAVQEISTHYDLPMQERIFKEGRSVVMERVIAIEGRPVIYRKVTQPWGDVNYFREGIPITSEGWSSVFGDL